ncbi:hypothetical protein HAV15_003543 [Penicillium sp. str. |nr:hypothetical protein HAV15_003543 [Penicillium sp. str. \
MPGSTPHRKPPAPEGVPPPSGPSVAPAAKPSSELASTQNHPSWPPMRGAPPPLDAGAKGACLEVPPIESPPAPSTGRCATPLRAPLLAHFEPDGQAGEPTGEYPNPPKCPLTPRAKIPGATTPKVPSASPLAPMVSEPTGQQSCRSDAGPRPVVWLPPPSARRCRNN